MPTYQYACTSDQCGLRFERVQAFTDPAVSQCPDCSERVRKVYGSVGVVFKGSGFYRNDSRPASGTAEAGSGSSANGSSEKSSENSSEKSSEKSSAESSSKSADSPSKASPTNGSSAKSSSGTPAKTS